MTRKPVYHPDHEGEGFAGDEQYEECEICHQEFRGVCPINSADCPYADAIEEEDEDDTGFEDVDNLDDLIADDEEIEKIIEDDVAIPLEDLKDEEGLEVVEEDEGPSKTIEEIEAEQEEAAKAKKKSNKVAAKPASKKGALKKPGGKAAAQKAAPKKSKK